MEADQTWSAGAWLNQTQTTYTYDATNNFVLTEIYHSWNSGTSSWDVTGKKVNTYDASNNKLTALIQEWTAGTWQNYSLSTYSSFVTQLPQTEIYQMWNTTTLGFDNATKYTYTYNDANQLTNQVSQTWNIGGFWQNSTADRESRFYYEPYTTGVNNLANNENSLILYPVPATDRIHIDLQWGQIQPFTVWIYNVQGIIIDKWEVPATASYYDDVPLNLPTGNYFMRFSGVTGNIVQQFLVAR